MPLQLLVKLVCLPRELSDTPLLLIGTLERLPQRLLTQLML